MTFINIVIIFMNILNFHVYITAAAAVVAVDVDTDEMRDRHSDNYFHYKVRISFLRYKHQQNQKETLFFSFLCTAIHT